MQMRLWRLGLLSTLLMTIGLAGSSQPVLGSDSEWNLDSLPKEIRSRVCLRASEIPPLPVDSVKLADYRSWPPVDTIRGMPCRLQMVALSDIPRIVRSMSEAQRGEAFLVRYECDSASHRFILIPRRGPEYVWSDRRLAFRIWHSPGSELDTSYTVGYFEGGATSSYDVTLYAPFPPGIPPQVESLSQLYARNGQLVGLSFESSRAGAGGDFYYLRGRRVSRDDFQKSSGRKRGSAFG